MIPLWGIAVPLGKPVVPEVYCRIAISSAEVSTIVNSLLALSISDQKLKSPLRIPELRSLDTTITGTVTYGSNGTGAGAQLFTSTNGEMTMNLVGVGTASGSTLGSYSVDLIWTNLFVS